MLQQDGRIDQTERTGFESSFQAIVLSFAKRRMTSCHVDGTGWSKILCRLKDSALLAIVEWNGLHVIQRETSQIDLSVLSISQLNAVIEYAHMLSAKSTYVDSLQTTDSSIILYLDSGKIADCISHRMDTQFLKFFSGKHLYRNHFFTDALRWYRDFFYMISLCRVYRLSIQIHATAY